MIKAIALVAVVLAGYVLKLVVDAGAFKTLTPRRPQGCAIVKGPIGAEDVAMSPSSRRLFISADQRPEVEGGESPVGDIWTWDPESEAAPKPSGLKLDFPFHPHGLDVIDDAGATWVFAVNHRGTESTVELFEWKDGILAHRRTFRSDLYIVPNDVAATGPTTFYLTHDHGSKNHTMKMIESYARIGRGYVTYFDGQSARRVAEGIRFANGVLLAPERLYVASMLGRAVLVYRRGPTGDLAFEREIFLGTAPDNITWAENGDLLVGAHPNLFKLKAKNGNHALKSPSQVLRVSSLSAPSPAIEEIFVDSGDFVSAVSVALETGRRLVFGTIYDDGLVVCTQPSATD